MISRKLSEAMTKLTHALRELFGTPDNASIHHSDDFIKDIDARHNEQEARVERLLARQQRFEVRGEQSKGDGS